MGLPMAATLLFLLAGGVDLLSPDGKKAVVLLFVRTDCPISNRYAPEFQRLFQVYSRRGVDFRLVYMESSLTAAAIKRHREEYGYTIPSLPDSGRQYVQRAHVRVTPEAAVFLQGRLVYRGRIDDRNVDIGKTRPRALHHDLEDVLTAVVAGNKLAFRETRAVGCAIENLP